MPAEHAGKIQFAFYFHCTSCNRSSEKFRSVQDTEFPKVIYCAKCGAAVEKRYYI